MQITTHAWEQFIARWPAEDIPSCPMAELERLLSIAKEEDIGFGAALRIISNDFKPAAYYVAEGWRFVFNEEQTVLVTCERIIYKTRPHKKRRRR